MENENESFMDYVKDKKDKKKQKQTLNPKREQIIEKSFNNDMDKDDEINAIYEDFNLNKDRPNMGTRARQTLLRESITLASKKKKGKFDDWVNDFSVELCVTPRTARENYLNVLIKKGIIRDDNGELTFVGIQKDRESHK